MSTLVASLPENVKKHGAYLGFAKTVFQLIGAKIGAAVSGVRLHNALRKANGEQLSEITALVESGAIKPIVDRVFTLDEIAEAHLYQESSRARGKIIIQITDLDEGTELEGPDPMERR